jgi:nitrogen fixation/metabolism regulation signal transduction histidine kinase
VTFHKRLLLLFSGLSAGTVIVVSWIISQTVTRAFERLDDERTKSVMAQIEREFQLRSREVTRRIESIASSDVLSRLALELSRADPDPAPYVDQAAALAREQALDFLEILASDGTIISSAHYPARFGYKKKWITQAVDWKGLGAFVELEELPEESAVALLVARTVGSGRAHLYVVGGQRIDKGFLDSLATPRGMRAVVFRAAGPGYAIFDGKAIGDVAARVRQAGQQVSQTVTRPLTPAMTVHGIPLNGRSRELLEVLVLTSVRDELWAVTWLIRGVAFAGAALGIALGFALSWWAATRVAKPVSLLAERARDVAGGRWNVRAEVDSPDEIGELARAFNTMTGQLVAQRDRLVQVERVAAWRELARRLAHELKNPLFPLQITVENLQRARAQHPEQFEEVFQESTATLLAELAQLRSIVGRFSDFARMPAPNFETVRLDELIPPILRLFEAQWQAPGHPPVNVKLHMLNLGQPDLSLEADPEHLSRALRNLVLNAMDAMPGGGTITIAARSQRENVVIEVADTGTGLTKEECERLFSPYYTTKQHGTGLGLAIVQSVVSDHGGRISVRSEPGKGTTFVLELPARRPLPKDRADG